MKKIFDTHIHYTFEIPLEETVDIFHKEFSLLGIEKNTFL